MSETEQNKTEEPTPYKLKRAREKGSVARGIDLGFFAALAGFTLFWLLAGADTASKLQDMMRRVISSMPEAGLDPRQAAALTANASTAALQPVALLCATVALTVVLVEIVQLRGVIFTTQPLKPDFNRLNPAKGLKRIFSMRMLKETAKNVLKLAVYCATAYFIIQGAMDAEGRAIGDAPSLVNVLRSEGLRLLSAFVLLALLFAALDQVIVRGEYMKQMRMTRSELTREHKEREGEPRLKQRRKQLHAEFVKQTRGLGDLRGSDMLIVNPTHYAIALSYDASRSAAPVVTAKGRNRFALLLRRKAALLSIPVYERPALARALYRACDKGAEIAPSEYRAVADLYLHLKTGDRVHAEV